ncbi:UPF0481 protein At3g47200-like, partial [Fagus crenata]
MDLEPVFRDMEIVELTTDSAIIFRAETRLTVMFQGMDPDEITIDIPLVIDKRPEEMLDSCLMTCQRGSEEDSRENRNPQPGNGEKENPWQSYNILQDLILLENQ